MKNNLIYFFYFLLLCLSMACKKKERTLDETLEKSITWMWKQQSPDGGWHSNTHAVLRDGIVLTPYILFHLVQLKDERLSDHKEAVDRAVEFITASMRSSMNDDSTTLTDYPNYSAAYALRVLHFLDRDTSLQRIIANYLLHQQFTEQRGFTPDSLAYGGWGYGEPDLKQGEHGHEDMSHTRRVVQALVEAGYIEEKAVLRHFDKLSASPAISHPRATAQQPAKENVILFLLGAQRAHEDLRLYEGCISRSLLPYDGGFVSSVVTLPTNKSQPNFIEGAGYHYPSYATATCDGFLTMEALGMKDTDAYDEAKKWLLKNQHYSFIDGLSLNDPEQWTYIMHYYHLSVRSEAMNIIEPAGSWRDSISNLLIKEQLPEGEYMNPIGGINKEDDPLVATIFCIEAGRIVLGSRIE